MAEDVCTTLLEAWKEAQRQAKRWQTPQLVLGWSTVVFIIVGIILIATGLLTEGIVSSALSLVTGGAAVWFNSRVTFWHDESIKRLTTYVTECRDDEQMQALSQALE